MEFSVTVATNIGDWQLIKFAEDLGYDRAWVPDSPDDLVGLLRHAGRSGAKHLAD